MSKAVIQYCFWSLFLFIACSKNNHDNPPSPPPSANFQLQSWQINGTTNVTTYYNSNTLPLIRLAFSSSVNKLTANQAIVFKSSDGASVSYTVNYSNNDSVLLLQPSSALSYLTAYNVDVNTSLQSSSGKNLSSAFHLKIVTSIDSTNKFPLISDSALLTLVQQQTFQYFWNFGHPVSGMARERNNSGDVVTTGGTGFGIMAMIVAVNRNFITRTEGLNRIQKIVSFLKNNCIAYHGAFSHWINGSTGATIPFSAKDDGGDLVETSYLMQGLLCARQYFNAASGDEVNLRNDIQALWQAVEWNWYQQNNQNTLYWHWSSNYGWAMNMPVKGWNEALITYVLAASSPTHAINKAVYDNGWAQNGAIVNGKKFFNYTLPLGPDMGGPLFFAHYSFLGINPNQLSDAYANYYEQNKNHTLINYSYCSSNPKNFYGYSSSCWGLTASDDNRVGYLAHEPNNDDGVISPTAALSSFPYTPNESMNALKFFYYILGDKLWKEYGFIDAFNLNDIWFSNSYLAIDQGPIVVMIENYRSGLLWNLLMSCPEIKTGMGNLGFQSPYL